MRAEEDPIAEPVKKKIVRVPIARCGLASKGQKISLQTNHFKVNVTNVNGHFLHYSVAHFYEDGRPVDGKGIGRRVLDRVHETYDSELDGKDFTYDGEKSLFTVGALPRNKLEFTIVLEDITSYRNNGNCSPNGHGSPNENDRKRLRHPYQSKTFKVEISFAAKISMQAIAQALRGQESENSQEALRVLDIILRQHAAKQGCLLVRQSFFHNDVNNLTDVGGGVFGCRGFHSSFRTTQGGLSLNIDVSTTMIIQPGPVVDFLIANQNVKDPFSVDWAKAKRVLKNLRVKTSPTRTEYKITGLSDRPCKEQTFTLKQKGGKDDNGEVQSIKITVYDYFINRRHIELRYSAELPCINVGKPKRPTYFPLEGLWDGDLFRAAPLNSAPSDCRSRQLFPSGSEIPASTGLSNSSSSSSDGITLGNERGKGELEKRRRVVVIEDEVLNNEAGSLNLKLGGQVYPITEEEEENWVEKSGKKTKLVGAASNRAVCQVEGCRVDLSNAKDYHRRHKVCDLHSKATRALVGNVMQRFCQQCSRFHALQEFDEGRRSCRRRLAGHNRRRRKTHPENATNGVALNDERSSSYLLISLLRILSNIHSNSSDQTKDQDLLSHLLTNLASLTGTVNGRNLCGLLNGSQDLQDAGVSVRTQGQDPSRPTGQCVTIPASGMTQKRVFVDGAHGGILRSPPVAQANILSPTKHSIPAKANDLDPTVGRKKLHNIDLNNVYDDSEECMENLESSDAPVNVATGSPGCPLWIHEDSHKSSSPQASENSGSTSTKSPSSSNVEAQSRTDRIVFKLFGKDPSEFPLVLRSQILDWLKHSPTDIESYIRPGCIILSVYLRMENSKWEELFCDLRFSLRRLLDSSSDSFWKTGWVYTRVRHHVAFVYDGQVVLDTPLPLKNEKSCKILSVKPIAVSVSERAQFLVKGFSIFGSTTRILCALEGKYLVQQNCSGLMDGAGSLTDHEEVQSISFPCSIPDVIGRGFIEVEDHTLRSSFFPFIVAEQDVCSEIRTLESAIEVAEVTDGLKGETEKLETTNQALDFVHELGWLLHRNQLKFRLGPMDPNLDLFPFRRFRCIMEFSLDRDWCAVVKKLLCILFSGTVDAGGHPSIEVALLEIALLHRAVRRNCRPMVEALLSYYPDNVVDKYGSEQKQTFEGHYFFRPDTVGPGGLTPLHIAASRDGSEGVLDAMTNDPQSVGIEAWRNARDCTGLTPHDYACQRGHYSYIHMVQTKIEKKLGYGHVVVEIPGTLVDSNMKQKLADGLKSTKVASLETEKTIMKLVQRRCDLCEQKLAYGNFRTSLQFYRPAMLSMVAIAAVCVCAALLFKSSPEVHYVFRPFRWELLKYGSS